MLTMLALLFAAPQDPEALRKAIVAKCTIPDDRLAVEQWTDPVMEVLVVKGDGPLSDAQHICFDTMISGGGIEFAIEDESLGERFEEVRQRERMANAREALASRGLLRRLPVYRPDRDDPAAFAKRLERLCGARPGSLLKVQEDNGFNIVLIVDSAAPRSDRQFQREICAINALVATGFDPWGAPPPPVFYVTTPWS